MNSNYSRGHFQGSFFPENHQPLELRDMLRTPMKWQARVPHSGGKWIWSWSIGSVVLGGIIHLSHNQNPAT